MMTSQETTMTGKPRVIRTPGALRIIWRNGASLAFALKRGDVLGIRGVWAGTTLLRNASKLWRPLISTPDGIHYTRFILKRVVCAPDGAVRVITTACGRSIGVQEEQDEYLGDIVNLSLPDDEVSDEVVWELRAVSRMVDGRLFEGFSYRYRVTCLGGRKIYRLFDDASWEIGGHAEGNTLLLQGEVNPPVTELTRSLYFTTACNYYGAELQGVVGKPKRISFQRLPRIGTIQAFDFLAHRRGVLLGLFDVRSDVLSVVQKDEGEDLLHVLDELRRPLSGTFVSEPKQVLFLPTAKPLSKERQRDLWARVHDAVHNAIRKHYRVERSPIHPRIWIPQVYKDKAVLAGATFPRHELLYRLADRCMGMWADMGVKEICTHSLWKSDYTEDRSVTKNARGGLHGSLVVGSICNVRIHEISPVWGGPEALAYFVDKAHAQGIQVQLWWATHLSRRAPIFQDRPDFMMMARDGLPNGGGFGHQSLITMDLNNKACFDWVLGNMTALHKQTGFDGVFHDSYGNMTFLPVHFQDPLRRTQQDAYARLVSRMQAAGIRTFTVEGIGALGVGHFGMGLLPKKGTLKKPFQHALNWWLGHEEMVYGLNFGIGATPPTEMEPSARDFSFRCLAAGGRFGFTTFSRKVERWSGWLKAHNRIHARLGPVQGRREMLPQDCGFIWLRDGGDALLFSFRSFVLALPAQCRVSRVLPDGERVVRPTRHGLHTAPWAVYRVEGTAAVTALQAAVRDGIRREET